MSAAVFTGASGLVAFNDTVSGTLVAQRVESTEPGRFAARFAAERLGRIDLVDSRVADVRSIRRTRPGAGDGSLFLLTATVADGSIEHRSGRDAIRPGRVLVIPAGESFDVRYRGAARVSFVVVPAEIAAVRLHRLQGPIRSLPLGGAAAAVARQLGALRRFAAGIPSSAGGDLARSAGALAESFADVLAGSADVDQTGVLHLADREIAARLTDPRLDVGFLAHRLGVSIRSVHRAFAPTGTTAAAHIRARRLEAAGELLRTTPALTVGEVAARFGFASASAFSAQFRERFGERPSVWRDRA